MIQQGATREQVSQRLRLKPSTINEHLLTAAIFGADLPLARLYPATMLTQLNQADAHLNYQPLLEQVPDSDFFSRFDYFKFCVYKVGGHMDKLETLLEQHFGFTSFRPGQKELVQAVLDGRDALGILPTGSGKTLCYQLPALVLDGLCVVVEPLLALMDDQVARLQNAGQKQVVTLSSRLTPPDFQWLLHHLNQAKFLFVAPETLMRPDVLNALAALSINCFVIDEAHCIAQWGPDFRPAYLRLGEAIKRLHPRSCLALTATAPKRVQDAIVSELQLQAPEMVIASVDRPNIFLGVNQVANPAEKQVSGIELIQAVNAATIVYFDTKAQAETWAKALQQKGVAADFYHAGLPSQQRELIQRRFMAGELQVICATSAFGMGIDKADVRLVMYTYAPESLEAYSQGIGRAGRDGENSASVVLLAPGT